MIKLHSTLINDSGSNLTERTELNNILDFIHKDEYLVATREYRLKLQKRGKSELELQISVNFFSVIENILQ